MISWIRKFGIMDDIKIEGQLSIRIKNITNRFEEFFDGDRVIESVVTWLKLPMVNFEYYKRIGEDYLFLSNEIDGTRIFIFLEAGDEGHYWSSAQSQDYMRMGLYRKKCRLTNNPERKIDNIINGTFEKGLPDLNDIYLHEILYNLGFFKFCSSTTGSLTKKAL